jgi:dTDP-4-dehydrorhamnose 3,5-epimerase
MRFVETPLKGAYLIDLEKREDERGFFARFFCSNEFAQHGLDTHFVQANNSFSAAKGTLRGIHQQLTPKEESKLVRCLQGAFYDVIVDLRPGSPTYCQWFGEELSAKNRKMMYVPKGFGHAFLTLEPNTEAFYMVSEYYSPAHERGYRYDDPAFKIKWPFAPLAISEKDKTHPLMIV